MGSYCSLLNNTDQDIFVKFGPNTEAFTIVAAVAAAASVVATLGLDAPVVAAGAEGVEALSEISNAVTGELEKDGYTKLSPGGKYTTDRWSLSLLMQVSIVKKTDTGVNSGVMAVWTGATNDSTMEYNATDCSFNFTPYA